MASKPSPFDVEPAQAGLSIRVGDLCAPALRLRGVGHAPNAPAQPGWVLDLVHEPTAETVRLWCRPRELHAEGLAVHGDVSVEALNDVSHAAAESIRAGLSHFAPSLRFRALRRTEVLRIAPREVSWESALAKTPGSIKISDHCNEACAFCSSPRTDYAGGSAMPPPELVHAVIRRWADEGLRDLQFVDREPTLNPRLAEYIDLARSLGFEQIRINTNGVMLADGIKLAAYVEAGLTEICISLHAAGAEKSDHITGATDGFLPKLATIRAALRYPRLHLVVNTVATRENLEDIPAIARLLEREFGSIARPPDSTRPEMVVSFVGPIGDGAGRSDLMPRFREAATSLAEAVSVAGANLTVHEIYGFPPCCVDGSLRTRLFPERSVADAPDALPGRVWLEGCRTCRLRPGCGGIWQAYLDQHGAEEFVPV